MDRGQGEIAEPIVLRVAKEDSAFLYQLLESYEGLTSYSTLNVEKSSAYRDILLHVAPDLRAELERVLSYLRTIISMEIRRSLN